MSKNEQELTGRLPAGSAEGMETENGGAGMAQVPVTEAIRYRKRAQAAEQQAQELRRRVEELEQRQAENEERLQDAQTERMLTEALVKAGAADLEAAVILAKHKLQQSGGDGKNPASVAEGLRQERPYLFEESAGRGVSGAMRLTAGVRGEAYGGKGALRQSAARAAASGSRKDMQEYLRMRRSMGLRKS